MPRPDLELVPNLPHRLRELRLEMGWSLKDVADLVGVSQPGVVSNWEATNQRRRTPEIATLLLLQRWYGVSMDYLLGFPGAEQDSTIVTAGKQVLKERLRSLGELKLVTPSERACIAVQTAMEVAPVTFFTGRICARLMITEVDFRDILARKTWPQAALLRLSDLLGIKTEWFFSTQPVETLNRVE